MSRRQLQITSGLLGVIPVFTGLLTMMGLSDPIYAAAELPVHALLDSNLRFLGGLWLVAPGERLGPLRNRHAIQICPSDVEFNTALTGWR